MDPLIFTSQFSLFYTRTYWQLIPNGNLGLDPDVGIFFIWQILCSIAFIFKTCSVNILCNNMKFDNF